MNDKISLPFYLGVDRHNRTPQGDGHPMLRALRNLMLSDRNELVRRKSMEFRQTIIRSNQSDGGLISYIAAGNTEESLTGGYVPLNPLTTWLPPFKGTAAGTFGRVVFTTFECTNQQRLLLVDGESQVAKMPTGPRRPQAVMWHGALWVVCGEEVPEGTTTDLTNTKNPRTGIIRVGEYTTEAGVNQFTIFSGMGVDLDRSWTWLLTDPNFYDDAAMMRPRVIGTYRGRMVLANFPNDKYGGQHRNGVLFSDALPGTRLTGLDGNHLSNTDVPRFARAADPDADPPTTAKSPWYGGIDAREFLVGDDGEEIIGVKELSLMQLGAMNQSALVFLKDRSIWLMTGEPLTTDNIGAVQGDAVFVKQPIADGCASFETLAETPWGIIWAGHDDVYFMPNGGGPPVPIGRRIAPQLKNTPPDMQWRWHAVYHDGWYRLFIMGLNQNPNQPVAMEECWALDLRYGPPQDWTQARWFGPWVYQPIGAVGSTTDDGTNIYRGVYITAVEQRTGLKKELFCVQAGMDGESDNYAWVLCSLDGEDNFDWALPFAPTQYRPADTSEAGNATGEKRIVAADNWAYGRQVIANPGGNSALGEPNWSSLNAVGDTVTDNAITWVAQGKVAVPGNWNTLVVNDGEDAFPTARGNALVCAVRTMELGAQMQNRDVQLRGLEMGVTQNDAVTWALAPLKDGLHSGVALKYTQGAGNFRLGASGGGALDTRVNDPISPFAFWVDADQYGGLSVGKFVSLLLCEYPYFTFPDELVFSYYFNTGGSTYEVYSATLSLTGTGFGALPTANGSGYGIYDFVVNALNASLAANGLPGAFSHNMTSNPATCPVKPTITHSTNKWFPNCYTDPATYFAPTEGDSPELWLSLGFDPIGPGPTLINITQTNVAPNSPWAVKLPKLRIANLVVVTRSFKRGPV